MHKGLLTLLLLFTCFARAQVVDTWQFANPQQQQQALNIASQLRCPQCQNQNLLESNAPVAVSMRHQVYSMVAEGKSVVAFIRKASDVDTPLCTIEIRQDTIVQARGMSNRPAENIPNMRTFIKAWAKNKGLRYAA